MIIDFHTHCFLDNLAPKAMNALTESAGLMAYGDGTLSSLLSIEKKFGVDKIVVNNIATNENQMIKVNDYAKSIDSDDVIAFGSVYPYAKNVLEEIDRIADMGLKGIKLHPEFQKFDVDSDFMMPIYKKIASKGLIITFHAGKDNGYRPPYHSDPKRFAKILDKIDTNVVLAHWGSLNMYEDVLTYLCGKNVYFDISFGYQNIPLPIASDIVNKHGTKKLLFGTDMPWHTPEQELYLLDKLNLSKNEKEDVLGVNAFHLLYNK